MCMMMLVAADDVAAADDDVDDVGDGHAEVGDGVVGGNGLCGPGTTRTSSDLAGLRA